MAHGLLAAGSVMPRLHTEVVGAGRPRFVFLHGLFGRGRNWTQVAADLAATDLPSVLVDLPDHGQSSWTTAFDYTAIADLVAETIGERLGSAARLIVVGHSLGGKVAMLLALRHPHLVSGLGVIDISPADSEAVTSFVPLIDAMRSLDLATLHHRADADAALAGRVPDAAVRGFLLQNLRRRPRWHWQLNLDLLGSSLASIRAWPDPGPLTYPGPVFWLSGEGSSYVLPEHEEAMQEHFPTVRRIVVPDAGHWVQADNPTAVVAALRELAAVAR